MRLPRAVLAKFEEALKNGSAVANGVGGFGAATALSTDGSEADFQKEVIGLAQSLGWAAAHFRKVRVQRADGRTYWETPVAADGKGWPDLFLIRERMLFRELKTDAGRLSADQVLWRDRLLRAGADWAVWRPKMWERIREELT